MYAWIDGEVWAGDDCPPVTEMHGLLMDPMSGLHYGRILNDEEELVITRALLQWRAERYLPLEF
jgi:hypothetical protein